jgi:beta-glucosidase
MQIARSAFPPDFLFGVATSSYQIEGHGFGGAGRTHWDDFADTPGNVHRGEHGRIACDHYHRWPEDLDLIAAAGFDVYRFSTSWARVLPEGRGTPNAEGLDFYDRLVDGMLERGLKPALTLYHWEMPSALADLGGWRNPDAPHWFADYTTLIAERLGDRLWSTATINEFWCVAWLSHFLGVHAPGLRDIRAASRAVHYLLKAHGTAVEALRAAGVGNIGAVFNLEYVSAADETGAARGAAARYDALFNRIYLDAIFHGTYPAEALEGFAPHLPQGWEQDMDGMTAPLDWCGLNFYTASRIAPEAGLWPNTRTVLPDVPRTDLGWEIAPEGLTALLNRMSDHYTHDLPLYVTENGTATSDALTPDAINDAARIDYFSAHLAAARRALDAGVPLRGYFAWSLLDNYEWALGYNARFGLVHVDFETQARTPKASYEAWAAFLSRT